MINKVILVECETNYVYKLTDPTGNCFGVNNEKLAMLIFSDYNNPFNCLEMIPRNEFQGDILNSIKEFNDYFY